MHLNETITYLFRIANSQLQMYVMCETHIMQMSVNDRFWISLLLGRVYAHLTRSQSNNVNRVVKTKI